MNNLINKTDIKTFNEKGYLLLKKFLPKNFDKSVKETIVSIFENSLFKTNQLTKKDISKSFDLKLRDYILKQYKNDKEIFVENIKLIKRSRAVNEILINYKINSVASQLLGINMNKLIFTDGNVMPNMPKNTSLLYSFHSEASWLPLRRSFINFWMPIINNKNKNNGTISLLEKSHNKQYSFYEYYGYNNIGKKDQNLLQYEIPKNEIKEFKEIKIDAQIGDVLFFHKNLVHKSNVNNSIKTSYFFNCRYFDISNDLTFSSNLNIRPYSEQAKIFGRPNIKIK